MTQPQELSRPRSNKAVADVEVIEIELSAAFPDEEDVE